jgi:hypothetical protein
MFDLELAFIQWPLKFITLAYIQMIQISYCAQSGLHRESLDTIWERVSN